MLYSSNLVTSKPFERSPVKMFLSSRQAGYSNRQQKPKTAASRAGGPCMLGGGVPGHAPPESFENIAFKWLHLVHYRVN